MILLDVSNLAVQFYEPLGLLRLQWLNKRSLRLFNSAMQQLLILAQELVITHVLVDMHGLPDLGLSEQTWLSEKLPVGITGRHLTHVALIIPSDRLYNQMVVESLLQPVNSVVNIDIQFFTDTVVALDWLTPAADDIALLEQEWELAFGLRNPGKFD